MAKKMDEYNEPEIDLDEIKADVGAEKRKPLTLSTNCGKCKFFSEGQIFGHPCKDLGVIAKEYPCTRFVVSPSKMGMDSDSTQQMLKLFSKLKPDQLELMAAMLHISKKLIGYGFVPGQTVYFKLFSGDYVSNYVKGVVLTANHKHVFLSGKNHFVAQLHPSSLLTQKEWKDKKQQLIEKDRIKDPKVNLTRKSGKIQMSYDPPLFEKSSLEKKKGVVRNKNKKSFRLRG